MLTNKNPVDQPIPFVPNHASKRSSISIRRHLPQSIRLPLGMVLVMFLLVLIARAIGIFLLPPDRTDPLSSYQAIMPGQSTTALSAYTCQSPYIPDSAHIEVKPVCVIVPGEDTIQSIVVYARDEQITRISFAIKHMRVIDLVWRWGQPDQINQDDGRYVLSWHHPVYAIVRIQGRYSPQARVSNISIIDPDLRRLFPS